MISLNITRDDLLHIVNALHTAASQYEQICADPEIENSASISRFRARARRARDLAKKIRDDEGL